MHPSDDPSCNADDDDDVTVVLLELDVNDGTIIDGNMESGGGTISYAELSSR